jgi:hypothetical protein
MKKMVALNLEFSNILYIFAKIEGYDRRRKKEIYG